MSSNRCASECVSGVGYFDIRVDLYLTTPGYEISKGEHLVKAMEQAHKTVFNKPVPYAKADPLRHHQRRFAHRSLRRARRLPTVQDSARIWSTRPKPRPGRNGTRRPEFAAASRHREHGELHKVYAMAAIDICNKKKDEVAKSYRAIMDLTFAHYRNRFCMFRTYYALAVGSVKPDGLNMKVVELPDPPSHEQEEALIRGDVPGGPIYACRASCAASFVSARRSSDSRRSGSR